MTTLENGTIGGMKTVEDTCDIGQGVKYLTVHESECLMHARSGGREMRLVRQRTLLLFTLRLI